MAYLTFSFSSKSRKKSSNVCKIMNSDGLDNRNWIFRVPEINQKWVYKTSWTSRFYFVIFAKFLMIFQSFAVLLVCSSLKNDQISQQFGKMMEVFNFPEKPISTIRNYKKPKSKFQIPSQSIIKSWLGCLCYNYYNLFWLLIINSEHDTSVL